jgi:hypothetical protein
MSTLFAWNIIYLVSGFLLLVIAIILHRNIGLFPPTKSENYAKLFALYHRFLFKIGG